MLTPVSPPLDPTLISIAALGTAADRIAYTTGEDVWAETVLTAFGRTILDDADATGALTTLGGGAPTGTGVVVRQTSPTLAGTATVARPLAGTTPAGITGVLCYLDSEMVAGPPADGAAISSVTASVGGQVFTGSGGTRPTYSTTNTINSRPTWTYSGSQYLDANAAILTLSADWCAILVLQNTTINNDAIAFGLNNNGLSGNYQGWFAMTAASGQWRFTMNNGSDRNLYADERAHLNRTTVLRICRSGGNMRIFVNGQARYLGTATTAAVTPTLNGAAVFRLGNVLSALGFGSTFRFAALVLGGSSFGTAQQEQAEDYLFDRYGLLKQRVVSADSAATGKTVVRNPMVVTDDPAYESQLTSGGTVVALTTFPATFSVHGTLGAKARSGQHHFTNDWANNNTLGVQNLDAAGLSVVNCFDHLGAEKFASGYGNPSVQAPWGGYAFVDTLNAPFRIVTNASVELSSTDVSTVNAYKRFDADLDGNIIFWEIEASPSHLLRISRKGVVANRVTRPAALAADTNNCPVTAGVMMMSASGADRTVTGLVAAIDAVAHDGQSLEIWNTGASNSIILANESASSTAANRIATSTGVDITIAPKGVARLRYDATAARWRLGV